MLVRYMGQKNLRTGDIFGLVAPKEAESTPLGKRLLGIFLGELSPIDWDTGCDIFLGYFLAGK